MRLRLDKLVLSAGLALAMVATTIPVMPVKASGETVSVNATITTKVYSGSSIVDLATDTGFISAVTGVSAGTTTPITSGSSKITKEVGIGSVTSNTLTDQLISNSTDSAISNYLKNNGLIAVDSSTLVPTQTGIVLQQVDTYDASYTYTVTAADVTAKKTYAALETAAVTKAAEELKDVTGSSNTEGVPVTGGTKTIVVNSGTVNQTVKTADNNDVSDTSAEAVEGATITVTTTGATVTNNYTITDLSLFGYTVKNTVDVSSSNVEEGAVVYKVLKVTKDFSVSEVESTLANNELTYDITDLASSYMIAYSVESTSDALIASAEEDATYTGVIEQIAKSDLGTTAAEKLAEAIEANSAKLVAYLNVAAYKTDDNQKTKLDETANELTFKIAVPVDVDTTGVVFKILRYHGSSVDVLDTTVSDGYIYFTSNKFSEYALVTVAADTTTEEATDSATEATTAGTSTTSTTTSTKTADNSMMPLFMTTLLLALCAGSLAIYKEKKTN